MLLIYHRVSRVPVLPALAAAGVLVIVGVLAVTTLAILGIVAVGIRLLCAVGLISAERPLTSDDSTIEGVVVNRSSADMLER